MSFTGSYTEVEPDFVYSDMRRSRLLTRFALALSMSFIPAHEPIKTNQNLEAFLPTQQDRVLRMLSTAIFPGNYDIMFIARTQHKNLK